jgi:hypothetical protein
MDETISFGTLGKTGRGVTEYYNVPVSFFKYIVNHFMVQYHSYYPNISLVYF